MPILSKEKNEFIAFFKQNITLILLGLYTLSFVNYYLYYKSFEISIFNYVGLNDLLFFSLEYIFNIILLIFVGEVILFMVYALLYSIYEKFIIFIIKKKGILYLKSDKKNTNRIDKILHRNFSKTLKVFRMSIVFISAMLVIPFLPYKLVLFPTLLIYLIYYFEKLSKEKDTYLTLISATIIIIFFTIITTLVNAYDKRFEKDDYVISFNEEKNFVSTDTKVSCYNYLGETTSNIFLYDIENKESKIYFKDKITDLKIKNSNTIDNYILKTKSNFFVKAFIEMLNQEK